MTITHAFVSALADGSDATLVRPTNWNAAHTVADGTITSAMLRDSAALSVIGRASNTSGVPADIEAASDNQVLRRSGTAIAFGAVVEAMITLTDITTANVSTTAHGFAPKAPNSTVQFLRGDASYAAPLESLIVAVGDETTALTTGTAKVTFRMPYAMTLTAIRASVTTAPTGGTLLTVDVNEAGTTILSTKLTFDASEFTTTTAATPPVISDSALADDAQMTIDIDAVGSTVAGAGLKVTLIGRQV